MTPSPSLPVEMVLPPAAEPRDAHFGGNSYEASMLRNLLAVIHGDGGHYVAQHGLDKAAEDAEKLVANLRTAADAASPQSTVPPAQTALEKFNEHADILANETPLERLRFFCSQAMNGQDWLDAEQFFDAIYAAHPGAQEAKDAARYRHMRASAVFLHRNGPGLYWYLPRFGVGSTAEQLDTAVDAAIAAQAAQK